MNPIGRATILRADLCNVGEMFCIKLIYRSIQIRDRSGPSACHSILSSVLIQVNCPVPSPNHPFPSSHPPPSLISLGSFLQKNQPHSTTLPSPPLLEGTENIKNSQNVPETILPILPITGLTDIWIPTDPPPPSSIPPHLLMVQGDGTK